MRFEWDSKKERQNIAKHGVSFKEAKSLLTSKVDFLEIYDTEHSDVEERFIAIGPIRRGLVLVVFTERARTAYASSARVGQARPSEHFTPSTWRSRHEG